MGQIVSCRKKKKRHYGGGDVVDEWLMNQVAKYVNHDKLGSFARDLEVDKSVYANIAGREDRIFEVSDDFHVSGKFTKLPPAYVLRLEGYVFTAVCLSTRGGGGEYLLDKTGGTH